jgi:hypothetical protein
MGKFIVLGAMHDERSVPDVIAYADSYEDAEMAIETYTMSDDSMVDYDFFFIEDALAG